jgi:BirA family biotin operon repressor/biotin-[acetyl-CoA-carboxylase] ligase
MMKFGLMMTFFPISWPIRRSAQCLNDEFGSNHTISDSNAFGRFDDLFNSLSSRLLCGGGGDRIIRVWPPSIGNVSAVGDKFNLPPLNPVALQAALDAPWSHLDVVETTRSTNSDLLDRAGRGEHIDGVVLLAEHQTAGRGRGGRSWSAIPRAQITMSVAISAATVPTNAWGWLPLATGVAVVDAVAPLTTAGIGLKWPNDVLAGELKLAGILAEVASPAAVIVVGVGLNVAGHPEDAPAATSLADLGVASLDRNELVTRLLHHLGDRVLRWRAADGPDRQLIDDYRARSTTIGSRVRALLPGGDEIVGTARTVDEQGRLVIDVDGRDIAVSAGDVVHVRH